MSAWRHPPHSGAFRRENDSAGPRVRALTAFLRTGSASYTRTAIVMQWPHSRRSSRQESLATFDGRRSPSAFTAVSAGRASPAVAEPAVSPTVSPSKRDSLLCDGDTVDAVLGSVFD